MVRKLKRINATTKISYADRLYSMVTDTSEVDDKIHLGWEVGE